MKIFKRKARQDIYEQGITLPARNKQGFITKRCLPKDKSDKLLIEKGEIYYTWHFKGRPWSVSKEKPNLEWPKSEYTLMLEDFEERKSSCSREELETLVSDIESYADELESRLYNMPSQLQDSSILNDRIDELRSLQSEVSELVDGLEEEE